MVAQTVGATERNSCTHMVKFKQNAAFSNSNDYKDKNYLKA